MGEVNCLSFRGKKANVLKMILTVSVSSQVAELEAHGGQGPSDLLKDELSQSLEELEALLKAKDEVGTFCRWSQRWEGSSVHHGGSTFDSATQTWSLSFILF